MTREKSGERKTSWKTYLAAVICLALLVVIFNMIFSSVTDRILSSNLEAMEELAKHDENSIRNSLNLRWDEMETVALRIEEEKCTHSEEVIAALNDDLDYVSSAQYMMLMDSDNLLYRNTGLVAEVDYLSELCNEQSGRFVAHYNADSTMWMELRQEILILGVPVDFNVGDIHFDWLLCQLDILTLENELKIDSYNSEGFSSVIDTSGNYIINISRSHSLLTFDNFFEDLEDAEFDQYTSVEELHAGLEDEDMLSVIYTQNGRENIMVITALDFAPWYFITTVPMSVFETQSDAILRTFLLLLFMILLVVTVLFVLIMRQRRQKRSSGWKRKSASRRRGIRSSSDRLLIWRSPPTGRRLRS